MKNPVYIFAAVMVFAVPGMADSLKWEYTHGWTKGYVVTVNGDKGIITLHDRGKNTLKEAKVINSKNVLLYVRELLNRIPEDGVGQAAVDGDRHTIELTADGVVKKIVLFNLDPPGSIVINENYTADTELKEVEKFRKSVDGYLLREVLFQLITTYFPREGGEEVKKDSKGEQNGAGQPKTGVDSQSEGSDKAKPESEGRSQ